MTRDIFMATRDPFPARRKRRQRESGQAGAEILAFGFVLLIGMVLLVANVWAVIDAKLTVTAAAREGVRAMVEANADTADADAHRAVDAVITGANRQLDHVTFAAAIDGGTYERCARVTIRITAKVASIALPHIGGLRSPFRVSSTHSELVDPFRSGLEGVGTCA